MVGEDEVLLLTRIRFIDGRGGPAVPPIPLEQLGESGFREFSQLGCSLELWDGLQFLERGSQRVGETPDRSRPEVLVFRLEVEVMHGPGQVFRSLQSALDKRFVDHHLGRDVRKFAPLPGLHLLPHRLEIALHAVDADRNAIDE